MQIFDNSGNHLGSRGKSGRLDHKLALVHCSGNSLLWAAMACTQPTDCKQTQLHFYARVERLGIVLHRFEPLVDAHGQLRENEVEVDGQVRDLIRAASADTDCDTVVVFGADGGFTNAVKDARRAGKNVYVIAWDGTLNPALAAAATAHISMEQLLPIIGRIVH